jgi:hypothetical protein
LHPYAPHNGIGKYERVPVLARDVNGDLRPVMVKGPDGRPVAATQVHHTPPAEPWGIAACLEFEVTRDEQAHRAGIATPAATRLSAEQAAEEARQLAQRAAEAAQRAEALAQQAQREAANVPQVAPLPPAIAEAEAVRQKIAGERDAAAQDAAEKAAELAASVNIHDDPGERARKGLPAYRQ